MRGIGADVAGKDIGALEGEDGHVFKAQQDVAPVVNAKGVNDGLVAARGLAQPKARA